MNSPKVYYGWWIVLGVFLSFSVSTGVFLIYNMGVFIKPIAETLSVSRGEVTFGMTIATMMGLISLPIIGRLVDRFGPIRILLPSIFALAACLASMYWVTNLVIFYIICGCMNTFGAGIGPVSLVSVIVRWFDRRRGIALGVALCGMGLGATVMPLVSQALIDRYGWQTTFVVLAVVVLFVALPVCKFILRDKPEDLGLHLDGDAVLGVKATRAPLLGMNIRDALKARLFWLMAISFFLTAAVIPGTLIHMVPMLTDRGFTPEQASHYAAITGISLMVGRIISGYSLDRLFAPYVAIVFWILPAVGVYQISTGVADHFLVPAVVAIGLALGAEFELIAYFVSRYFGLKNYGVIYGIMFSAFSLGAGAGPALIGHLFDLQGSYLFLPWLYAGAVSLACVFVLFLGGYPDWSKSTNSDSKSPAIA
ncbi:MFS transporter [Pseudomonas guariconensis]|uniref:MFS transporter n=1 Tax=Pseudomonas guariconensis TaxID=1288410 RepID=UPI0018A9E9F4|nr:MFS transporter [Pseudomonas guariconensis]MBF8721786.1 MFS transporter [Pseudomonas guariconensis]